MKKIIVLAGLLLSVAAGAAQTESFSPCEVEYFAGIEFFEQGKLKASSDSFYRAIRVAPVPETEPVEYIPYLYMAAAYFESGRIRDARDALIQSQVYGVAANTETGKRLLEQYAVEIMTAPLDELEFVSSPQSNPVESQVLSLSANEAELIRAQVLSRCSLSAKLENNLLPWYFHYEYGMDLMRAGDAQRAIDSFLLGANVREDPSRSKRMYGMWFIDYLPYYQIALAHARLGDWERARDAIETSENYGEFSPSDADYDSFSELNQLIKTNLENHDS